MKLVSFDCPCCGAKINTDGISKKIKCDYCEKELYIDEEYQRVMLSPQNIKNLADEIKKSTNVSNSREIDQELISNIRTIRDAIETTQILNTNLMVKKNKLGHLRELRGHQILPLYLIPSVLFLLMLFISVETLIYSSIFILFRLFVFIAGILITFFTFRVLFFRFKRTVLILDYQIQNLQSEITNNNTEIDRLKKNVPFELVPKKYQDLDALDYIYGALIENKAFTLQQAINQYETKLYTEKMDSLRIEELQLRQQQLDELRYIKAQNEQIQKNNKKNKLGEVALLGSSIAIMLAAAKKIKDDLL